MKYFNLWLALQQFITCHIITKPMKTQAYISSVLCFALFPFPQGVLKKHETGWENEQLKGRVKSCRILYYNAIIVSGNVSKSNNVPFEESYSLFDTRGNEIESSDRNSSTHKNVKIISTYNSTEYCTKTVKYEYNGKDTTIQVALHKYDDKGNEAETQLSLLSKTSSENGNGSLKAIYKYDVNGNLLQGNYIKGNDTTLPQNVYTYDKQGNVTEDDFYNGSENLQTRTINVYNVKGTKTERTDYWYNDGPAVVKKLVCQYDEHGNVIKGDEYDAVGTLLANGSFKIYYDNVGNRIKQIEYINNKPVFITEYKIIYYQ